MQGMRRGVPSNFFLNVGVILNFVNESDDKCLYAAVVACLWGPGGYDAFGEGPVASGGEDRTAGGEREDRPPGV